MAKETKETKAAATANDADIALISDESKRSLIVDHLLEIKRLAAELPTGPGGSFDDFEVAPATPEMRTVRDSPEVKRVMVSIDAAVRELSAVETAVNLIDYIASRLGLVL